MQLRPYQETMVQETKNHWGNNRQNVIGQLSTGGGKSVILSSIVSGHDGACIIIAHRTELVSQLSLTLARFGIRHNIIAPKSTIKEIISIHCIEYNYSFHNPRAPVYLASVDTLLRLDQSTPWFKHISLVIIDEAHHVLKENKWGRACQLFPHARGFFPTATPIRADGKGLGRQYDGIMDELVIGPSMRELITEGFLSEYRIFAPPSNLDLTGVNRAASGDFSPAPLRNAVHKSRITGDIVEHYLKIAPGKRGVTFAVDIKAANDIALEFRLHDIPAEVISSLTPPLQRQSAMRRFRSGELLQLVNVDILGEGVDVPAIEVVSMGRPTDSYSLFAQQFGRALRPIPGKTHAIIIDHVNNYARHGLPDAPRQWSLQPRGRRSRSIPEDAIPLKTCLKCLSVYTRFARECPHCGHYQEPQQRNAPEFVDGDLFELDTDTLARLRGEAERNLTDSPKLPGGLEPYVIRGIQNRHAEKIRVQNELRNAMANWAGYYKHHGATDSEIYRRFYYTFNIDILSAQSLGLADSNMLYSKIVDAMDNNK